MRRRIWSEFLPPEELGGRATVALLQGHRLEPLVALPPEAETAKMASALSALGAAGLRVGLWPLLDDADGYWPSEQNVDAYRARVLAALDFARGAGVEVRTLAVDLEPPLPLMRRLMEGLNVTHLREVGRGLVAAREPARRAARDEATRAFAALRAELEGRGVETLAAVIPPVVVDLAAEVPLWQAAFRTPVQRPAWSVVCPMMYTSVLADLLPSGSQASARAFLFEGARMLRRQVGAERAALALGLVSPGKLETEPALRDPGELAADVAAARAAGVDDLALFSLEGVLRRGSPERWLTAFCRTGPGAPSSWRRGPWRLGLGGFAWALRAARPR